MRLLLVEDDAAVTIALVRSLRESYEIDRCQTADEAEYLAGVGQYAVIILDLSLPDGDGIELCRSLRRDGVTAPILVLTGRYEEAARVAALDSGADDYLLKPCSLNELKARLRALLRRHGQQRGNDLVGGKLKLNPTTRTVTYDGKPVNLRRKEFDLLEFMMRHSNQVVTRQQLIEHVWDHAADTSANTIDVHIKYLRDRIDRPFGAHHIRTSFGVGYSFAPGPPGRGVGQATKARNR